MTGRNGKVIDTPAVPPLPPLPPNRHQLAGRRGAARKLLSGASKKNPPPHIRKGESPYKQNPAIKWKRSPHQTGAQADKIGGGTYNVKGRTQAAIAQFSYEEVGGPLPWERQPNESPQAYHQFQCYRDMDPVIRSNYTVEAKLGLSRTQITRNCAVQRWVERAAAWDFHLERARLIKTEGYLAEMHARHAEIAQEMLKKTRERLLKVKLSTLGPREIAQWLDVGVKVERLARGVASGEVKGGDTTNINVKSMSMKQLMIAMAAEGRKGGIPAKMMTLHVNKTDSSHAGHGESHAAE